MIEKIEGIVLDVTRHTDRHNVVTLFTRSRGRLAFLSGAGGGRAGKMRASRLQPLAVIEGDINFRQVAELQKLGAFSLSHVWTGIYFHPVKAMMVLFLSEFLNRLLRATMADEALYDFIVRSLQLFNGMESRPADFHIAFLASLLPFMGIQPDPEQWREGVWFDMRNGTFIPGPPPHSEALEPQDAMQMAQIAGIDFSNISEMGLCNETRRKYLELILKYYSAHYPGLSTLNSLEILREVGR